MFSLSHTHGHALALSETRPAVAPLATHPTTAQKDGLRSMQLVDMEIMRCTLGAIILAAGPPNCRQSAERGANRFESGVPYRVVDVVPHRRLQLDEP